MKAYDLKDFIDEIRRSPSKIPPIQMLQVGPHLIPTVNSFHNLLSCLDHRSNTHKKGWLLPSFKLQI